MKLLKRLAVALVLLVLGLVGAGAFAIRPFWMFPRTTIDIVRVEPLPSEEVDTFVAGVAVRDITTPIGIPKMGYSSWARSADGFRTRL